MFFWTTAAAQVALRMETMRKAEAGLLALARRFGDGDNKDTASSALSAYKMELFDTVISSSILPFRNDGTNSIDDDDEPLTMHAIRVTRDNNNNVESSSSSSNSRQQQQQQQYPLVIVHGYMNGALYFYRNLAGLADYFDTVVSVDLLGWGLSSRPSFDALRDDSVETAEAFFVESLEAWRSANRIEKMNLAGHSMGGYLSVAYCERYPERVDRLLLLSPVGVPEETPERRQEKLARILTSVPRRLAHTLFTTLWDWGYTPGSLLRAFPESGGRRLVEGYVGGRLPAITDPHERAVLAEYMYTGNILPGSGEHCLSRILHPGAMAKKPLLRRIPKLKVETVSFFYGMHDWMDAGGGLDVQQACRDAAATTADDDDAAMMPPPSVNVYQVKNAGHLLMLENSKGFNAAVVLAAGGELPVGSMDADRPVVLDARNRAATITAKPTSSTSSEDPPPVVPVSATGSTGSSNGIQATV